MPAERVLDRRGDFSSLCGRFDVTEIVVAMDDRRRGFPIPELLECRLAGVDVTELLTFLERETGRVRIDVLNPELDDLRGGLSSRSVAPVFLADARPRGELRRPGSAARCRSMLLTVLAIKLEDGWRAPVLYRQARVGLGGQTFNVLKFRSMRTDAERERQAQWAQNVRSARDARRSDDPQAAHRRAAADLQRAARPHELRRPAARAPAVRRGARAEDSRTTCSDIA